MNQPFETQPIHYRRRVKLRIVDWAARFMVAAAVLDFNNIAFFMFGIRQVFSYALLAASLITLAVFWRRTGAVTIWFAALIIAYLAAANLYFDTMWAAENQRPFNEAFTASIIILTAAASYTLGLRSEIKYSRFMSYVRNVFIIGACSVWASPILFSLYKNLPKSSEDRLSGFYGSPNDPAYVSCFAVVLILAFPFRKRVFQIAALGLCAGAAIMTFSKTGMMALMLVFAYRFFWRTQKAAGLIYPAAFLAGFGVLMFVGDLTRSIAEMPELDLNREQKSRIIEVGELLNGDLNKDVTTGRSDLWALALNRAVEAFPHGHGLGSFHYLIGGVMGPGRFEDEEPQWLGAHNFFLMIWGEAGFFVFLAFVFTYIRLGYFAFIESREFLRGGFFLIFMADFMASHNGLTLRFHAVALGIFLAQKEMSRLKRRRLRPLHSTSAFGEPGNVGMWDKRHVPKTFC